MGIENIENEELKQFAKKAGENGWDIEYKSGILYLSNHKLHSDISVCWEKGNISWSLLKKEENKKSVVPINELNYPSSIFF